MLSRSRGVVIRGDDVSAVDTRAARLLFIASTHVLFEIILILKGSTGRAVGARFGGEPHAPFCLGFAGPVFPVFEMKTLPEKPATSFVLFETARLGRVGRVPLSCRI
jgi:hypothetical protein